MSRVYYRTVKNNKIKLRGKILGNNELQKGELDGMRFCFFPYKDRGERSGFSFDGLTALWGTERLDKAEPGTMEEKEAQQKNDKILAPDGHYRWYFWNEL